MQCAHIARHTNHQMHIIAVYAIDVYQEWIVSKYFATILCARVVCAPSYSDGVRLGSFCLCYVSFPMTPAIDHCPWMNNCVGAGNFSKFSNVLTCCTGANNFSNILNFAHTVPHCINTTAELQNILYCFYAIHGQAARLH